MTPADAARLLAVAAAFDRRTVGELDALAWADALAGLDPRDCAGAIRAHYGESTEWIMPAHVRERVLTVKRNAAQRIHTAKVQRAITAATEQHDPAQSHARYLEVSRQFHDARVAAGYVTDDEDAGPVSGVAS